MASFFFGTASVVLIGAGFLASPFLSFAIGAKLFNVGADADFAGSEGTVLCLSLLSAVAAAAADFLGPAKVGFACCMVAEFRLSPFPAFADAAAKAFPDPSEMDFGGSIVDDLRASSFVAFAREANNFVDSAKSGFVGEVAADFSPPSFRTTAEAATTFVDSIEPVFEADAFSELSDKDGCSDRALAGLLAFGKLIGVGLLLRFARGMSSSSTVSPESLFFLLLLCIRSKASLRMSSDLLATGTAAADAAGALAAEVAPRFTLVGEGDGRSLDDFAWRAGAVEVAGGEAGRFLHGRQVHLVLSSALARPAATSSSHARCGANSAGERNRDPAPPGCPNK